MGSVHYSSEFSELTNGDIFLPILVLWGSVGPNLKAEPSYWVNFFDMIRNFILACQNG